MSIREDFQQKGFIDVINVHPMDRTEYYTKKCEAFIDSY